MPWGRAGDMTVSLKNWAVRLHLPLALLSARKDGVFIDMDYEDKSLKSQLKRADKLGVKYTIIIGEEELRRGVVKVRDMRKSLEEEMSIEDLKKLAISFRI